MPHGDPMPGEGGTANNAAGSQGAGGSRRGGASRGGGARGREVPRRRGSSREPGSSQASDGSREPGNSQSSGGRTRTPVRRPSSETITHEQLERVIRRASDLQFRDSGVVGDRLGSGEVVQIGAEVGLEERHVRQALAEVQAASLLPTLPSDEGLWRRVCGPAIVSASRVAPGSPSEIAANLEPHLREGELLKQVRSRSGGSLWEPAGGLVPQMRRSLDVGGRGYMLARARSLQVAVEPLESGWSLVTLTADLGNVRNEHVGGWFAGMSMSGVASGVGLMVATGGGILPVLGGVAIFSGFMGIATAAARSTVRKTRERMELALEGLLDRLERGENLAGAAEPWHRKLLR